MPGKKDDDFKYIGYATADYVLEEEKSYHKIHGILLDIRSLINHHTKSNEKIKKLEETILS